MSRRPASSASRRPDRRPPQRSRARQRPEHRPSPWLLLLLGAVVMAGIGAGIILAGRGPTGEPSEAVASAAEQEALGAQQMSNGPIANPAFASELDLKLEGTKDTFEFPFKKAPRAGLLFDLDTGEVLWRKNPNKKLPIASVTKMMTSLVVADRVKPGSKVLVTKEALDYTGSGVGVLPKGKWIGVSAMLHGLLLASGNDTAIALAQKTSGTVDEFVDDMNLRAQAMGMRCSHYASPSGIVDEDNYSCAADLAIQARAILDDPQLAKIVARREAVLPFPIKGGKLYLYNHNPLLKARYQGTLGIKTGYTDAAGKCIVVAVKRNGRRLGLVLLHSPDIGKQSMQIFDYAFSKLAA